MSPPFTLGTEYQPENRYRNLCDGLYGSKCRCAARTLGVLFRTINNAMLWGKIRPI